MNSAAPAAGAAVRIAHLTVRYPDADRPAVNDVSLDVPAGALVVILGASGSGKSTLLRSINRLVEAAAGTIEIDGADIHAQTATALRRGIGYAIQAVGLFPHLSVAQNIAVVPELLGWDRSRTRDRVDELLSLVQLEPARYRERLPHELSGGEQQRVGVARALAARPRLLLMDEPFGAVDAIVRLSLQDEIRRIHRALGTTILFVTHDVEEALRIADRVVVMANGRVLQYDIPLALLATPADAYVARLLESGDAIRRLGLIPARSAMTATAGDGASHPSIGADRSLRDALGLLLAGAERLDVIDGERAVGTLGFDDLRQAIGGPAR